MADREYNVTEFRFRRGTIEEVNLAARRLDKWFIFKFTAPVEFKGVYGAVGGVWKWATAVERDSALKRMKQTIGQDGEEDEC